MTKYKIGILTYHYAYNIGAVLQAYSLQNYLLDIYSNVSFIDYKNIGIVHFYSSQEKYDIRGLIGIIKSYKKITPAITYVINTHFTRKRHKAFQRFIKQNLIISKLNDSSLNDYKYVIVGSDQIWNPKITNTLDMFYFLNFKTSALKIAYAASNGSSSIPDCDLDYYKTALSDFSAISTREKGLAYDIEQKIKLKCSYVLDPSFLLTKDKFSNIIKKRPVKEKYLFCYFVTNDDAMHKYALDLSNFLNLKIIEFHYSTNNKSTKKCKIKRYFSPADFLTYLSYSDFVLTNSFHGVAFSIIFRKQFQAFYQNDSRKDELLNLLKLEKAKTFSIDKEINVNNIDYNEIESILNKYIDSSREFLKNTLQ